MKVMEKWVLKLWPWVALVICGALYTLVLPEHTEIQSWIFPGMETVTFPIWFLSGGLIGIALSVVWSKWPNAVTSGARRLALVIFAYIGIAILIALLTGEGEGIEKIGNSGPVKVWGFMVWTLLSISPSLMGVLAILHRSKWARGVSILSFISTASATMIYAQASSAEVISQDPFLSIVFIWSIIAFVEGMNWQTRYLDPDDSLTPILWKKQAAFTLVFLGAGSIIAYLPFLFGDGPFNIYEGSTILGKSLMGLLILIPLAIAAVIKGLLENTSKY